MAPLAIGFGKVVPKVEWKAIAEVTGKIVYRHPESRKGQSDPCGYRGASRLILSIMNSN